MIYLGRVAVAVAVAAARTDTDTDPVVITGLFFWVEEDKGVVVEWVLLVGVEVEVHKEEAFTTAATTTI